MILICQTSLRYSCLLRCLCAAVFRRGLFFERARECFVFDLARHHQGAVDVAKKNIAGPDSYGANLHRNEGNLRGAIFQDQKIGYRRAEVRIGQRSYRAADVAAVFPVEFFR